MTLPTIHLNGDRAETLLEDYRNAMDKLRDAQEALSRCSPNGRNFYPQGADAITRAIEEHEDRARRLASVHDDLLTLALHAQEFIK